MDARVRRRLRRLGRCLGQGRVDMEGVGWVGLPLGRQVELMDEVVEAVRLLVRAELDRQDQDGGARLV